MADPWYKTAFGPQYPLLYAHRDQAEGIKCLQLLLSMVPLNLPDNSTARVLDLGCGDGRHLTALPQENNTIIGLDLSWPLLKLAHEKLGLYSLISLLRADMGSLPFRNNSYSAVLSLFTAFGYFGPLVKNAHVLQEISRVLEPGGHWYFDYFDCDGVKAELGNGISKIRTRVEGPLLIREEKMLNSTCDQVTKKVTLNIQPGMDAIATDLGIPGNGLVYTEEVALFSVPEISELAAQYQLFPVATAGNYDGLPLGQGDRWIMVFQKINQ